MPIERPNKDAPLEMPPSGERINKRGKEVESMRKNAACLFVIVFGLFANGESSSASYSGYYFNTTVDGVKYWVGYSNELDSSPELTQIYATSSDNYGDLEIPSYAKRISGGSAPDETYTIQRIRSKAFAGLTTLTKVILPDYLKTLDTPCFPNCPNLTSIEIANDPYQYPTGFRSTEGILYYVEYSLAGYSKYLYRYPEGRTNSVFEIDETITAIKPYAFYHCTHLIDLKIPDSIETIGDAAFDNCASLKVVFVSNAEKDRIKGLLQDSGFDPTTVKFSTDDHYPDVEYTCVTNGYTWSFTVEEGVATITKISPTPTGDVIIPNELEDCKVVGLGANLFYNCSQMTSVIIPQSVETIGDYSFEFCNSLSSCCLPKSLTKIGRFAFAYCQNLSDITIPATVASIDTAAFTGQSKIAAFSVENGNENFEAYDGVLFEKGLETLVACGGAKEGNFILPNQTKKILWMAFHHSALSNVVLPTGLEEIEGYAFAFAKLTIINIPSSVTKIGPNEFSGCSNLTRIDVDESNTKFISIGGVLFDKALTNLISFPNGNGVTSYAIPESVTRISGGVFFSSNLISLRIPAGVSQIGIQAFSYSKLLSIHFLGNAPTLGNSALGGLSSKCTIKVTRGSSGWGVAIPGKWNNVKIAYDDEDDTALPTLGTNPSASEVVAAVSDAIDPQVPENIDTTNYNDFRAWAARVTLKNSNDPLGAANVMNSQNAWLSYAIASDTLITQQPTNGQLKVENFESTTTAGSFDFTVSIDDLPVGDDALPSNLAKVFGIEGGASLEANGLSSTNVNITFGTPENGKVKFTAGPKNTSEGTFFMKVKMTP